MSPNRSVTLPLLLLLSACAFAFAGENHPTTDIPATTLAEASLGTYWYGAPIELDDLVGKVVLWETWGS